MPDKAKVVFSVSRDGPGFIVVQEDAARVMHLISSARSRDGFVTLTADSGDPVHVAVARILYVEPD
jgi:mevalonate pyrophosphate decarboxylase